MPQGQRQSLSKKEKTGRTKSLSFLQEKAETLLYGSMTFIFCLQVLSSNELDMMPSFRHLMKMLAAFDATFLVFTLSLFCVSAWSDHYNEFIKPWLIPYFLPVIQVHK